MNLQSDSEKYLEALTDCALGLFLDPVPITRNRMVSAMVVIGNSW